MSENSETITATVACLFQDEDSPSGPKWLDYVGDGWTETSLHHLVVQNGNISDAKAKDIYGHF